MRRALALIGLGLALSAPAAAQQQQVPNVLLKGLIRQTGSGGYDEDTKVTCRGMPTCTGGYVAHVRQEGCSNYLDFSGTVVFTGLNLAQSGTLQGRLTTTTPDVRQLSNGACELTGQVLTESQGYTGTWNLGTQKGALHITGAPGDETDLLFTADLVAPAEIFAMTVRSQIGTNASVSADIRFRDQDIGRNGSVYVFASAPAPQVKGGLDAKAIRLGASTKADTPCVLSQVDSQGQLVAVTSAQMQAFVTGAFSAAGTAVTILDNTPASNVAGSTFYVGYGSSADLMLDEGVFRNAVLVPGSSTCPPLPYVTSLWYNPSESGWGLNLSHQGVKVFATLFTYDSTRAPLWLVMPAGVMQPDGVTFTGGLYRTTGPAFNANPFTPIGDANITQVGTMTVELTDANAATLTYTNGGTEVQKNIQRQVYGARSAVCLPTAEPRTASTQYQDLWYNAAESGWGINVTHQDDTLFATLFTYDATGRGLWLVLPGGVRQGDGSYFGDLFRTAGSAFDTQPFPPIADADIVDVGDMRLRFTDGNTGTLTYTYNGTNVTKQITRQVFGTPQSECH